MLLTLLVCTGSIAAPPTDRIAPDQDRVAYETAEARVGRNSEAHVGLALWCEAHGLEAEKLKHLALAVLIDPKSASARGLLGMVAYRGRWQRPDAVAEEVRADAALAEYNARRARVR